MKAANVYHSHAEYALAFARRHDWGEHATLHGDRITGLVDAYVDADGIYHATLTSVPATVQAVREYGNY